MDLIKLGEKWLEFKKQRMKNLLKIALPDEALYREIMISLGYPKNKVNFLELALMVPYSKIKKLTKKHTIEKALLYKAGFTDDKTNLPKDFDISLKMNKSVWIHRGIRPANFPEKRIKGISELLSNSIEDGIVNFFIKRIKQEVENKSLKNSLKKIMNFEGIGLQRKEEMFFNIIMPFMMVYSQNNEVKNFLRFIFENYPPLSENRVIKSFKHSYPQIKIDNVKKYMGVMLFQKENTANK